MATLYFWALTQAVPLSTFLKHNDSFYVFLQALFSLVNSLLTGLAFTLWLNIKRDKSLSGRGNIFQAGIAFVVSIFTTGCYVCGSLLLPSIGLTAVLTSLPFGGLEIKLATFILLLHSVHNLATKYQGICKIYPQKYLKVIMSETSSVRFSLVPLYKYSRTLVLYLVVILTVLIPLSFPKPVMTITNNPFQPGKCILE